MEDEIEEEASDCQWEAFAVVQTRDDKIKT